MSIKNIKRRLFEQGVSAAKSAGITGFTYICPLCLRNFCLEDLESGNLTLEHVPAKSQGGKGIILTCRECNSIAGHELEAESNRRTKQEAVVRALRQKEQGSGGPAYAYIGGVRVNLDVTAEKDFTTLRISKYNNPSSVATAIDFLNSGSSDQYPEKLQFKIVPRDSYHRRKARTADLKAAYLTMVAAFGYSYALHDVVKCVREQIANPEAEIIPRWWGTTEASERAIGILDSEGVAIVSFGKNVVILPWPSRLDEKWISFAGGSSKEIKAERWPWPQGFSAYLDHDGK